MGGLSANTISTLKTLSQSVKNREQLQELVNDSLFGVLENSSSKSIVVDASVLRILDEIDTDSDISKDLEAKEIEIMRKISYEDAAGNPKKALDSITYDLSTTAKSINTQQLIKNEKTNKEIKLGSLEEKIKTRESKLQAEYKKKAADQSSANITAWNNEIDGFNEQRDVIKRDLKEIERVYPLLQEYINISKINDAIANSLGKGTVALPAKSRRAEIQQVKKIIKDTFKIGDPLFESSLGFITAELGLSASPIVLDNLFAPGVANPGIQYDICDPTSGEKIKSEKDVYDITTDKGTKIQLKGLQLITAGTPPKTELNLKDISIKDLQGVDFPVNITLSVRGRIQDTNTGANLDHFKKLNITINEPNRDLPRRDGIVKIAESNLTEEFLKTRLRQDYENKFNKVQREAFEKVLADNAEFAKLNQAQKDRLYERMQDLGTIPNSVKPINLGKDAGGVDVTYPVNDITFTPSTHKYSLMPRDDNYDGFKVWLTNQAPKDVLNDEEKYRSWLRNGLVASLDNGMTHYESFFADILKQFTDDLNVKTTLNKTLLDFINDTNTADHVGFEADLAATLNATQPITKKNKNYQTFFEGQTKEFKTESITIGGKKISYSGALTMHGAHGVSVSLTMQDGKEQVYKARTTVDLVRTLLDSLDIEPPHARFHAGLSVVKSLTKLARENGISLRSSINDDILNLIPSSHQTAIRLGPNPMVEIEEENGKLVAKVFNLNLTTKRKENEYKFFDEEECVASQSIRELRKGVQGLLVVTNQAMNNAYGQYHEGRFRSRLRPGLLKKPRYGGLRNGYKKLSFTGESISVGGKSFTLDCKDGLFTFSGGDLKKPVKGRNLGDLLSHNPALRGVELKALHIANEKTLAMYQNKLSKQGREFNYGVMDEQNHRVYIYDKDGNLGYYESNDQTFVQRWRQYTSGHRYGRINDENMPTGIKIMKRGDTVVDKESYDNFLRNETLVGSMVRSMSRTHRAWITWAPW